MVYEDAGQLWYRYLQNEFGAWSNYETIDTDPNRDAAYVDDVHYGLDVQVDAADFVQVAYISSGNTDTSLFYVYRDPNSQNWSQEFIVDGYTADTSDNFDDTSVGYQVEMAIDSQNLPVFAYFNETQYLPYLFDFTDDIVGFATGSNGVYIPLDNFSLYELVYDRGPNMYSGTHISLAQDGGNNTHVVYYNHNTNFGGSVENQYTKIPDLSTNSGVGLVSDPLSFISSGNICWPGQSVSNGTQSTHNSCGIYGNEVCVAYKNETTANLQMTCKPLSGSCDSGWSTEVVDSQGSVGDFFATLEFNSVGQPYIAYQDVLTKELRVATKENGVWEVMVVDDAANTGAFADMTIDDNDIVHISYLEKRNQGTSQVRLGSIVPSGFFHTTKAAYAAFFIFCSSVFYPSACTTIVLYAMAAAFFPTVLDSYSTRVSLQKKTLHKSALAHTYSMICYHKRGATDSIG